MHLGFIVQAADISIHALREEGDFRLCAAFSSPPISIHALREEGDVLPVCTLQQWAYFYPRPPRGGRQHTALNEWIYTLFLSTPSARRATTKEGFI